MRFILKKTIIDKSIEKVREAQCRGQEIDFVMLTPKEYDQLRNLSSYHLPYDPFPPSRYGSTLRVLTLESPDNSFDGRKRVNFPIMGDCRVSGVEVVCIPEEYHNWKVVQ